ncbi:NAD-dependent malic enzyme [Staphylococcus epidermidis]|uniref:NADP-dependent malic enzyme, putative n=1 Tax=Staphylococcus epidermidis (strain ATCC 35984 / DSM 28319 / BCRC 17069 / CCUG 31568 / BM 3577 / RP62A) TaxID=176279 RepID=Q5HNK3_STAEQ|nr:malic enzyme-like NAD(P)-binding protein [Staphylococcus epidermidis]AAW54653.1 NADP-dependent malic enzyme, putative [Staphylococcus epidermidis RP62A]EHR80326.1 malic enzyme, NAD-binding domain protein [Staphylococcus epidermidis VCU117]EHR98913.1 malic enzyme, NAD-binding domain protein [Staphylococcus epidermidis VCU126]KAB2287555.1 NAD-dependent malic enzyme [Staphylococcus epidermidis]MBM5958362.1 NAD-dependent malic enzyme [Staphylococcus epidermidis]
MSLRDDALEMHRENQGKLEITPNVKVTNKQQLSLAYSPGVAEPCKEIHEDSRKVYEYTIKGNTVAVVTDGTAVLGLGNIGAEASIPVMEGKAALFKSFAGINGVPIALDTTDTQEIIKTVKLIAPNYGGINLEDISAPRCFEIEETLKKETNIPIFHDDQHGTAIVTMAGLINALKIVDKELTDIKVVLNGAGAAGIAIVKLLHAYGVNNMIMCDSKGAIYSGRNFGMNDTKTYVAKWTNKDKVEGSLEEVIKDADVFIGVSVVDILTQDMVKTMADDPIIFAMANPNPEINPNEAKQAGAKVVGTGRSDFPNQINNVLAFPGIFRGALDVEATHINEDMKKAAVEAIVHLIDENELHPDYCIPGPFDKRVAPSVAKNVAKAAMESGVARIKIDTQEIFDKTMKLTDLK